MRASTTVLIAACSLIAFMIPDPGYAQQAVNQTDGAPSGPPIQTAFVYTGSNVSGICWARSTPSNNQERDNRNTAVAVSAVSKASAAVVTSVGHGFTLLTLPQVTISGATGTGWSAINSTFVATVIDADTFSIPVASTGFGTLAGTVVFKTTAPRQTVNEWAVQVLGYGGPGGAVSVKTWLNGTNSFTNKCSDAGSTTVGRQ